MKKYKTPIMKPHNLRMSRIMAGSVGSNLDSKEQDLDPVNNEQSNQDWNENSFVF